MSDLFETLRSDAGRLVGDNRDVGVRTYCHPRFMPVLLLRLAASCYHKNVVLKIFSYLFTWGNFYLHGVECSPKVAIGKGLFLPHPSGVVIGAGSIGENVSIFQGVTLGAAEADLNFDIVTRPVVLDNVTIGTGAKIIGAVVLHSNCVVGAGAVVLKDVPDGARAVGVPARVL